MHCLLRLEGVSSPVASYGAQVRRCPSGITALHPWCQAVLACINIGRDSLKSASVAMHAISCDSLWL